MDRDNSFDKYRPFEPKRQSVPRGIAFRLISVGSYSLMAALLKQASEHGVVAGEMLFYRAIFALPVVLFWALKSRGISVYRLDMASSRRKRSPPKAGEVE